MQTEVSGKSTTSVPGGAGYTISIVLGVLLLLVVFYVHFALYLNLRHFAHFLSTLFIINAIGALVAAVGVIFNARIVGWGLGIVMAGGAALAKILMNSVPGFGRILMQGPFGVAPSRPPGATQHGAPAHGSVGAGHAAHAGGAAHSGLPLFLNMRVLGNVSIILELIFVALAIYAFIALRNRRV